MRYLSKSIIAGVNLEGTYMSVIHSNPMYVM